MNNRVGKSRNIYRDEDKLSLAHGGRKSGCSMGLGMDSYFKLFSLLKVKVKSLSRVRLFATPWTVANQAPLSMGFSRQEYWSGLPFPSPGDLPNPGIEPGSPAL